jgi:hypothetical protein
MTGVDQRLSFVTVAVADLAAARAFYVDGLGWRAALDVPGEVLMFPVADRVVLSLWSEPGFEAEVGPIRRGAGSLPITLAHNVATPSEVDAVLAAAAAAGGVSAAPAEHRAWGGYSGYVVDPNGIHWEIAYNPGPIGASVLPPEED